MSSILDLINDVNVDQAIQLVLQKGNKVSNMKNIEGVSALMLATKIIPSSKAIILIDALMKNGAALNKRDDCRRHVLLYACEKGVSSEIFDRILFWNSQRKNNLDRWWSQCNDQKEGIFILACRSSSIDLVKHVASCGIKQNSDFFSMESNMILKGLEVAVKSNNEALALVLHEISLQYNVDIYDEHEIDIRNGFDYRDKSFCRTIYLKDVLTTGLNNHMYSFISHHMKTNIYASCQSTVWIWMQRLTIIDRANLPTEIRDIASKYERKELWKNNRRVALVVQRCLNGCRDLILYISSFLHLKSLDIKSLDDEEYFQRHAQYCDDCEGYYLLGTCQCCFRSRGYLSD